jgi:hypothetical protein
LKPPPDGLLNPPPGFCGTAIYFFWLKIVFS